MSRPLKKKISHLVEYSFTRSVALFVNLFPFSSLDRLAAIVAPIFVFILPKSKKRFYDNINHAFPDWDEQKKKSVFKANMRNTVRVFIEVLQANKFKNHKFIDKYITIDGPDFKILRERQQGLLCIQGHVGNWELAIPFCARHGITVPFSHKHQSNPLVDKWMLDIRKSYGGVPVWMEDSRSFLNYLKSGSIIGLVADQDAGPGGVFVPFMNRPASTFPGPALLSLWAKVPLAFVSIIFKGRGRYHIEVTQIMDAPSKNEFPDREQAIQTITQKWTKYLEGDVIRFPEQYFWLHRRWKSQPTEKS